MSLWVDAHRPTTLERLDYHPELTKQLYTLARSGDLPHLLVYGPPGAGKKTRVVAVLREIFGSGVEKLKLDHRQFETPSGRKLDLTLVASNFHIEMNPSDVGMHDRVVVQEVIKDIAQTQQVDANASRSFKIVVVHEADGLSREAQAGLRRTMEKYTNNLRLILVCSSTSKIIQPLRSRCLLLRVPAPSEQDIARVLLSVAKKESIQLPEQLALRIAERSDRNLRRSILLLEAAKTQSYPFSPDQQIEVPDWQRFIEDLATFVVAEQSPERLRQSRDRLYELLVHCIPATIIMKTLAFAITRKIDVSLRPRIMQEAADAEHRMQQGSKPIFHLEAFLAKFMSIYRRYVMDTFG